MSSRAEVLEEYAGKLENYELVFNKKVRGGVATANVRQAPGKIVQGVLTGSRNRRFAIWTGLRECRSITGAPK